MDGLMKKSRQAVGKWGEERAEAYLVERGYRILNRNTRTPYGEIDLVAMCGDCLVFVEVKTRTSTTFGYPEEAITADKRAHILASAQSFLQEQPDLETDWRVDVIAIQTDPDLKSLQITHFENAITAF
jgi:putative endonuclease